MAEPISVPVVSQQRQQVGEINLPDDLFNGPVRAHLPEEPRLVLRQQLGMHLVDAEGLRGRLGGPAVVATEQRGAESPLVQARDRSVFHVRFRQPRSCRGR